MSFIKTLKSLSRKDLLMAGGKAANLGELIQANFPVPSGFVVTTEGYYSFVTENGVNEKIRAVLRSTKMDDPIALGIASEQIRFQFEAGQISPELSSQILVGYAALGKLGAVAVRSSATAEDLPDLSFAGQQDTYLNIIGEQALLIAIVKCWGSLWTARAIGYRARNVISHDDVSMAVVVQQMVQSESSGVLFTANPLSGKRYETVIDATFGLGEALVSGQVEPDHYIVDPTSRRILSKSLGVKGIAIHGQVTGGTSTQKQNESDCQALPDDQIIALAQLGQQAEAHFGSPQDMEWAWVDGKMFIVQSRPITSLYPLPANVNDKQQKILLSFGVWQGMLDPYTPLGQDMLKGVVAGMALMFGITMKTEEQGVLLDAGGRLFVNLTGLLTSSLGRNVLKVFVSSIDPVSNAILDKLFQEFTLPAPKNIGLRHILHLARGLFPILLCVFFNLLWPIRGRARLELKIEQELLDVQSRYIAAKNLAELVDAIEYTSIHKPKELMPYLLPGVIGGQIPLQILIRLAGEIPEGQELVLELTRGLPHNVTTEMDLALWRTAQAIRFDSETATFFSGEKVSELVSAYKKGGLPPSAQTAIGDFLSTYGVRCVGEIDLGRPRWREDPTHIFQVLKSYLQIDPVNSPEAIFQSGTIKARQAQEKLTAAFLQYTNSKMKSRLVKIMVSRLRELGGLRETPKFVVIRLLGHIRAALLSAGQDLVDKGILKNANDVLFLHLPELKRLASGEANCWKEIIVERRATHEREFRRKRVPRIMLSDGTAFFDATTLYAEDDENIINGCPVSSGVVEGTVRVVFDPHGIQLVPGEILVCPATDPAWTPLFLTAGGLVMEVGGMMTHGSVVAREYGIPAVVGIRQATERLQTGQRVRVDGGNGKITVL